MLGLGLENGDGTAAGASHLAELGSSLAQAATPGPCAVSWPPFSLDRFIAPSRFTDGDFSLFARADGRLQVAYRGRLLYRFDDDQPPGDTNGHGVSSFSLADPAL